MPRNTESGSSNTGVVTRSLASLTKGEVEVQQLTVPCSVNLVKLRQSSKKLVLKNGSGYYNLTREESLSYRIEGIKVLRTRNRSMPTVTQKRGRKMNRPDPRDQGFHHYSQSRESGFLNTSPGDYHKQGRFDGKYSGPYRSRGRDNRFEQGRHWSPRSNYGNRGNRRDSYGRDNNNSGDRFERRASSYPNESSRERRMVSPAGRYERSPEGDGGISSGFQERSGRYPDQRPEKKSRQRGSSVPETPQALVSTYRKTNMSRVPSNHTITQNVSEKEDSTQSKEPKENVLNNERTTQNHTLNKGKAGSPATSQGLLNSDTGKATQRTPCVTVKTDADKHKKKSVLTMSLQIQSLRSKQPQANVVEINEMPAKQSDEDDVIMVTSRTGNGGNTKGSPHRTEVSVPNHIHVDRETSTAKATEASSSGESESVAASPRKVHSARKSAPTSNVSRTQKSDMLKKQALLRSQSSQDPPASTTSSSPTARMCSGETKPVRRDSDAGSPSIAPGGKDVSESTSDDTSRMEEAFTPPRCGDIVVLSDTVENVMETCSQDNGHTEESTGQNRTSPQSLVDVSTSGGIQATSSVPDSKVDDMASMENSLPEMTSQESELQNGQEPEEEDQETASDEGAGTTETRTAVTSEEPERSPDVGKIKEKALLKLKENLKKNLLKGKISPQTSSPSSRLESRSSSNDSPESSMDTTEGTPLIDEAHTNQKELQASIATLELSQNLTAKSHLSSGTPDTVPEVNGKKVLKGNIGKPSEPCTGDNEVANNIAIDIIDDNILNSQSDKPQCSVEEMQTSQDSSDPVADRVDHIICNNLLEDSTCATEKSTSVYSPASKKDDPSMPEVGDSLGSPVDDLSDGSVDLGPHEPGDMDSIDDDLLLEDEPIIICEDYNPEPEKMDTSHVPESLDSEVPELAIARVESQSEDVLQQVDSNQPSTSKRTLAADVEDAVEEPVCKKSRTETADIIADIEGPEPEDTADVNEADKKEVIFTQNEWKEFALSIKEKYEKLVQTFNQKTNVMYEAQAHWQQETLAWKKNYEELERKYECLAVQVKEGPAVEKQSVEVQTTFIHRTKLSRKKKEATHKPTPEEAPQEEPMETEQGETRSSDAPLSSGTPPPQTTSDCEPSAAASSRPNSAPIPESTQPASNKSSNLEAKRQVFRATLNKVMLSKKNLSGGSEGASVSDPPSGKTSPQVGATTPQIPSSPGPESLEELSKEQPSTSNGAAADTIVQESTQTITIEGSSQDPPMDTSETGSKTADTLSGTRSPTTLTASMSTKGPNLAITASGTVTAASQQRETSTSKPTPSNTETSNLPSHSEAMSSQAIPSPSKSPTSTAGTVPHASQSKAQSEPLEKTKVPSATDSSKLPGSPKHSTGTASKEASKDSSKKSSAETDKETLVSKSVRPVQAQAEPEVIDLTDDPDPPTVSMSKPSAPSPHKQQDALPGNKHTTLTTRSPHSLSPASPSPSAVVSGANSVAASGTTVASANARQVQTGAPNLVLQNASQRSVQRTAAVQPEAHSRTGSKTGPVPSPKRNSPGVPQSVSPQGNKQSGTYVVSSSAANIQLRNVNPPVVTTHMQSSNVHPQVVSLQHGPRQQIPPAGRGRPQVTVSQGLVQQQRQIPSSQHVTTATISGLQPVMATMQNQARMQGQAAIQQRLQQQQQQISLQMLQQGRQGVHQLPGAAASAAALATRQPQTWIQQARPQLQVTSSQQQSLQVCHQMQLPTGQIQVQMVRPHGASGPQTLTTSTGQQLALQKQQQQQQQQQSHYQNLARSQASTQEQIQAQERAHAANQAQARAKAAREQREQEQHQQARMAAERLQSSQLDQQQAQRAQIKKLQEERGVIQTAAQQHQNKKRLLLTQIRREDEMQRTLMTKLSTKQPGMSNQMYKSGQKQLQELKEQERKLRGELSLVDKAIEECLQKSNQIEQRLRQATAATSIRLSPQEIQKHQLQQQQQQLSQQLAQRQIQQQRTQQLQQQQQQQQQQVQLQQQKQRESAKTKHPAQLPDLNTVLDVPRATLFTPMPIKPSLEIKHSQEGIVLSWKADPDTGASKIDVKRYLLYAYQESESATPSTDLWKKIGAVDALPLPMACTLTHFKAGSMYHFAVCAVSKHGRPGAFSNIGSINLP